MLLVLLFLCFYSSATQVSAIIHTAAPVTGPSITHASQLITSTVKGTENLLNSSLAYVGSQLESFVFHLVCCCSHHAWCAASAYLRRQQLKQDSSLALGGRGKGYLHLWGISVCKDCCREARSGLQRYQEGMTSIPCIFPFTFIGQV